MIALYGRNLYVFLHNDKKFHVMLAKAGISFFVVLGFVGDSCVRRNDMICCDFSTTGDGIYAASMIIVHVKSCQHALKSLPPSYTKRKDCHPEQN